VFEANRSTHAAPVNTMARMIYIKWPTDRDRLREIIGRVLEERPPEFQHQFFFVLGQNYQAVVRREEPERGQRPSRAEHAEMIDWLHELVPEEFVLYFARPEPGWGVYAPFNPEDRARYVEMWKGRRGEGR
jgi:hypothetical protein